MPNSSGDVLIRLKSVRSLLTIPVVGKRKKNIKPPKINQEIRKHLLETCIQNMISYIDREKEQDLKETIEEVNQFVQEYCRDLVDKYV